MYNGKTILKPYIFSMWRRLVLPNLNPANQALWEPLVINSSHRLIMEKHFTNIFYEAHSLYI